MNKITLLLFLFPIECFCILPPRPIYHPENEISRKYIGNSVNIIFKNLDSLNLIINNDSIVLHNDHSGEQYNYKGDNLILNNPDGSKEIINSFYFQNISDSLFYFQIKSNSNKSILNKTNIVVNRTNILGLISYSSKKAKYIGWAIFIAYNVALLSLVTLLIFNKN